jgi:hypothetical protein
MAVDASPVWSTVELSNIEALGGGTTAWDDATGTISPHTHVTVGMKEHSATAHTSQLSAATVQFLTEMIIVEVVEPALNRRKQAELYDVPLLHFGDGGGEGTVKRVEAGAAVHLPFEELDLGFCTFDRTVL